MKKVIQPVKLVFEDRSTLAITNLYNFVGLGHLTATWKVEELSDRYVAVLASYVRCLFLLTDPSAGRFLLLAESCNSLRLLLVRRRKCLCPSLNSSSRVVVPGLRFT